jgi:hypothetical protein
MTMVPEVLSRTRPETALRADHGLPPGVLLVTTPHAARRHWRAVKPRKKNRASAGIFVVTRVGFPGFIGH